MQFSTPLLMVIVMIAGDFLAMSLTTDNVRPSALPNAWRIGSLTIAGVIMGICLLAFCSGVLAVGKFEIGLGIDALRTVAFVVLVFGSQATLYAIRQRRHLWGSRPSLWLAASSANRHSDRFGIGHRRNRDGAFAGPDRGRYVGRCGCLRCRVGFGEGSGVSAFEDRLEPRLAAEGVKMKINSTDFRVPEGERVKLKKWPTKVEPVYKSKEHYQELLREARTCETESRSRDCSTLQTATRCC